MHGRDLAQVIRNFPADRVFAELLNEPDVKADRWQTEVEELAAFVRQLLPDTTLIIGPVNWQRADLLPAFRPLTGPEYRLCHSFLRSDGFYPSGPLGSARPAAQRKRTALSDPCRRPRCSSDPAAIVE